jgi:SAM-dependent methyltransferase
METAQTTAIGLTTPASPGLASTTVIVPTTAVAGRRASLLKAIRSAVEQSGVATRILVVVYGQRCDRALLNLLRSLEGINVIALQEADLPDALLTGRQLVETEYFCFLDDDDEILPHSLALRVRELSERPEVACVATNDSYRHDGKDQLGVVNPHWVATDSLHTATPECWLATRGGLYRTNMVDTASAEISAPECERMADLLRLVSGLGGSALDVGASSGRFSKHLAQQFDNVTALDLRKPDIRHPRIACVEGDVTALQFDRDTFDLVVCTEVLEHVPSFGLARAFSELARVTRHHLLIGVPYRQDNRVGRTTCSSCGARNPPWGHVNVFDEHRLYRHFTGLVVEKTTFVGMNHDSTNFLSTYLMDLAGNPYGTYEQDEPCVRCGGSVGTPGPMSLQKKLVSKAAFLARGATAPFHRARPSWIHLLLRKA